MASKSEIQVILEGLTGQRAPFGEEVPAEALPVFETGLGYSQLNELLLLFGFDRVTHAFFRFLLDGTTQYEPCDAFSSFDQLERGVRRFQELALLLYGNVKFAFKSLSRDAGLLISNLAALEPLKEKTFSSRHPPILPISQIPADEAYLTGYLIERQLKERLLANPEDKAAQQLECRRLEVVEQAKRNHQAYLASDHLDVYVATSMRERHEFVAVSRLAASIFGHKSLRSLKLRWFDPTQAYCSNRVDKGLAEALMLRRATCTIYLAQENDTLGKDSELASTLAQGKPVVAYLPSADDGYVTEHLRTLQEAALGRGFAEILLEQLRLFEPAAAWTDSEVRSWCADPTSADVDALRVRLAERIKQHYDTRARTLCESHPLGIQVNLETGVANGVLVVRSVDDCANLIRRILTRTLDFELAEVADGVALKEKISNCVFRVMTADAMLTNTFWNFYLDPAE